VKIWSLILLRTATVNLQLDRQLLPTATVKVQYSIMYWVLYPANKLKHWARVKCGVRGKLGSLKCREFGVEQKCRVTC